MSNGKNVEIKSYEIPESYWENSPEWAVDIRDRFGKLHYTDGKFHCKAVDDASWCKFYPVAEHRVVSVRPKKYSNEWFDKNNRPTCGEIIEVSVKNQPFREFEYRGSFGDAVWLHSGITGDIMEHASGVRIRPIRTEREKAIEAALSVMSTKTISNTQRKTINKLYDAGLLRLPEDKK